MVTWFPRPLAVVLIRLADSSRDGLGEGRGMTSGVCPSATEYYRRAIATCREEVTPEVVRPAGLNH